MLITDQVATAPCTDPVQAHFLALGQSSMKRRTQIHTLTSTQLSLYESVTPAAEVFSLLK